MKQAGALKTYIKIFALMLVFILLIFSVACSFSNDVDHGNYNIPEMPIDAEPSNPKEEVFLPYTFLQLKIGDDLILPYVCDATPDFKSSNEDVAIVDEEGYIYGISEGIAKISVNESYCIVKVTESGITTIVELSSYSATIYNDCVLQLYATSSDNSSITWTSSDESVATVKNGVISGIKNGIAYIYAMSQNASSECRINVVDFSNTEKVGYTLSWNDEFEGYSLDESKWGYMLGVQDQYGSSSGPRYWGNNEQQYYTKDAVTVKGGILTITAKLESAPEGRNYTSARICTRDKAFFTYGLIEARIKMPTIEGLWPAFWMLPQPASMENSSNKYGGWAANGEIDIMEAKGRIPNYVSTTLHFGNSGRSTYRTNSVKLTSPIDSWHVYAIDWQQDHISWLIDGKQVMRLENTDWWTESSSSPSAPFDVDFYILLNLAVGGNFDGGIEPDSDFISADMEIDFVRVYTQNYN